MTEEKKDGKSCGSGGCGCCPVTKVIVGLLLGAFIFAAGMWFAKSHCHAGSPGFCPINGQK
jgi:hypothetical protein